MRARPVALALTVGLCLLSRSVIAGDCTDDACCEGKPALRIGAVAYSPAAVTIFEGVRRYFDRKGMPVDYVLYSNYDALVEALHENQVYIAWNTPLAHARYHLLAGEKSRTLVMRDVDCGYRSVLVARKDAGIDSVGQLEGRTLVLGSEDAAEATVLPRHYLAGEGVDLDGAEVLSLDGEVDLEGNPCSSERYVLQALLEGRGDAGIIGERLWNHLRKERPEDADRLVAVWTTPPFSHCVFSAGEGLDEDLARRFTDLMTAMDPTDPQTADVMRLEGTKAWVVGSPDGFRDLLEALRAGR
jgi:ABC-type phosphate/phosphonate transport system substrate-binding protein